MLQICNSMQFPTKYTKHNLLWKRNNMHSAATYDFHGLWVTALTFPGDCSLFDSKLNANDTRKHECIQKSMSNEPKLQHY